MDFVKGWKKAAAHVVIGIAVALFAYFTVKTEASLGRQGVRLMALDSATASQ